jgi:hypothetical protein
MISVRNHLQLLNGNKGIFYVIFFVLTMHACTLFKGHVTEYEIDEAFERYRKMHDTGAEKKSPGKEKLSPALKIKDTFDILFPVKQYDSYRIAYILPLELNNTSIYKEHQQSRISMAAQEFYMGAEIALKNDSLERQSNFQIYILDNQGNSKYTEKEILTQLDTIKPHLIIGPFMSRPIFIINEYALKKKINFISPFQELPDSINNNPYFIHPKPPLREFLNFANYCMQKNFLGYNVIFLAKKEFFESEDIQKAFEQIDSSLYQGLHKIHCGETWIGPSFSHALSSGKNLVFCVGDNELLANNVINTLITSRKEVVLCTAHRWLDYRSLDISNIFLLNTFFMDYKYIDYKDSLVKTFILRYRDTFRTEPGRYAFLGYDLTEFALHMLETRGMYFQRQNTVDTLSIHTRLNFRRNNEKVHLWENDHILVLKFENYELIPGAPDQILMKSEEEIKE